MAKQLRTDELWQRIEPLIPKGPPRPKGGRPPVPDRATKHATRQRPRAVPLVCRSDGGLADALPSAAYWLPEA
jgi:transposase